MRNVPKLRFKEFEEEWNVVSLESLLQSISYGMNAASKLYDGENRYLRITDIDEEKRQYIDENKVSPDGNLSNKFLLNEGDLLFARTGASTGKSFIYKNKYGKMYYAGFLIRARLKENINPYFVYLQTLNSSYYNWVRIMSMRSGQPGINAEEYKKLQISITSKLEQDKIANFLETLERKILRQQEKIELLKEQKKGYMQKIFNRELRFKDENGKAYPEWKEYKFNDLFEPRNIKQVPDEEAPLMAFTSTDGIQDKGERYNREFLVKNKNKKYKKTFYNDIIYSSNNLDVGAIGRNKFGTVVISDVYEIFSVKEKITPEFAEALITQKKVLHKILKYRQGALYGQYRIHATDFLKVTTSIPSFKEQVKISSFIKKIDNKINLEEKLLFQLNLKQKSLLQQMFV